MDDIIVWIIAWLEGNKGIKRELIQENLNQNYFEAGWIDSLGFISFISDIELEFDIEFSNDDFQDRSFATICGLAKVIEGRLAK